MDIKLYSHYEILGISEDADQDAIKKAFNNLAKSRHSDKNQGYVQLADAKFIEIKKSYDVLSDPLKRKEYDSEHAQTKYTDISGMQKEMSSLILQLHDWGISTPVLERIVEQFAKVQNVESEREILQEIRKRLSESESKNRSLWIDATAMSRKINELQSENARLWQRSANSRRQYREHMEVLLAEISELKSDNTELELENESLIRRNADLAPALYRAYLENEKLYRILDGTNPLPPPWS